VAQTLPILGQVTRIAEGYQIVGQDPI